MDSKMEPDEEAPPAYEDVAPGPDPENQSSWKFPDINCPECSCPECSCPECSCPECSCPDMEDISECCSCLIDNVSLTIIIILVASPFVSSLGMGIYGKIKGECNFTSDWLLSFSVISIVTLILWCRVYYSFKHQKRINRWETGEKSTFVMANILLLFIATWVIVGTVNIDKNKDELKEECEMLYIYKLILIIISYLIGIPGGCYLYCFIFDHQ